MPVVKGIPFVAMAVARELWRHFPKLPNNEKIQKKFEYAPRTANNLEQCWNMVFLHSIIFLNVWNITISNALFTHSYHSDRKIESKQFLALDRKHFFLGLVQIWTLFDVLNQKYTPPNKWCIYASNYWVSHKSCHWVWKESLLCVFACVRWWVSWQPMGC